MKTFRVMVLVVFLLSCTIHDRDDRAVTQDINLNIYLQGDNGKPIPVTVQSVTKPTTPSAPKVQLVTKEVGCPLFIWPTLDKQPTFPDETLLINDDGVVASKFYAYIEALEAYLQQHLSRFQKAYEEHKKGCKNTDTG